MNIRQVEAFFKEENYVYNKEIIIQNNKHEACILKEEIV